MISEFRRPYSASPRPETTCPVAIITQKIPGLRRPLINSFVLFFDNNNNFPLLLFLGLVLVGREERRPGFLQDKKRGSLFFLIV